MENCPKKLPLQQSIWKFIFGHREKILSLSESWKWNEYFPPKLPPFSSSFTWGFRGSGDGGKGGVSGPTNANPTFTSGRNCQELKTSWIHPNVGFSSGCDDNYVAIPGASATGGMSSKPISMATKAQIFRQWGWFRGQVCIKHKYLAIHNPAGGVGEHLELWVKLLKLATMLW